MRRTRDEGAAAVEMALVVPVLLTLVLGIVDFGFAFSAKIAVTQAAREGARVIALGGSSSEATARVNQALTSSGQVLPVTVSYPTGCSGTGTVATVQVTGSVPTVLPIPDISVTARGVMRCTG